MINAIDVYFQSFDVASFLELLLLFFITLIDVIIITSMKNIVNSINI
ncbi:hypothetical protein SDC9_141637 [bioreactor metagenome]|uniref:Uncharacterized protein n=1 Tax=bioreactor metagenome TaxID=1076179 RepID=A0A645DYV7_9ZZZZ